MRRGETFDQWVARTDAQSARIAAAPHFVYRAFDSYGLLLYIGCTNNPDKRLATHQSTAAWYRFTETLGVTGPFDDRAAARAAERAAIDSEGAYFNSTQADIGRTQANRNAAKRSLWSRGWYRPTVSDDIDHRADPAAWEAAWEAIEGESAAWDRELRRTELRLKAGAYPYMTDADRLARYLAAREDSELAVQGCAA